MYLSLSLSLSLPLSLSLFLLNCRKLRYLKKWWTRPAPPDEMLVWHENWTNQVAESVSVAVLGLHRCILFPFSSCGPKTKSNVGHITCRRPVVEAPRCHIPMLLNLRNRFRKEGHAETNLIPWSCPKPDRSVPRHGAFRRSSRDTSDVPLADRGRERPHPGTSDVSTPPASSLGRRAAWAAKYSSSCISTSRSRMQSKNNQRKIISHHVCTNSNVLLYVCDLFFPPHIHNIPEPCWFAWSFKSKP